MISLTLEDARRMFAYCPASGLIINRVDRPYACVGAQAGSRHDKKGYRKIMIRGKTFFSHRLAWLLYYGSWPKYQIDHVNGITDDNRIVNLRDVSPKENQRNRRINKNNTSGVMGVCWYKARNKWIAQIRINGKNKNLGYFENIEDATKARKQADREYGYSPNHGRSPL